MQALLVLLAMFIIRFAIPIGILLYLGARQERRYGAAF